MKIYLSTEEGYSKDKNPESRKRYQDKKYFLHFTGDDAPVKAVRALIQKYGITRDQIAEEI
jgi:antitoxin component HigA of HigAB toxin-antitoxin module